MKTWQAAALIFLCACTLLFSKAIFFSENQVLGSPDGDLLKQYIPFREFGFSELKKGNLALWNPYILAGTPFFANFQSALLYPLNWLHLKFSSTLAINLYFLLHVFMSGLFTFFWLRFNKVSFYSSIVSGFLFMLSAPIIMRVYAGHLSNLGVIVWLPVILLAVDGLIERRNGKFVLLGAFAIFMAILAGNPQYLYFIGLAAGFYFLVKLFNVVDSLAPKRVLTPILYFVLMCALGAALGAIQLLPGMALVSETVRASGVGYEMAATFSLPPTTLLTYLAPNFFGSDHAMNYWGKWNSWEMSCYFGAIALVVFFIGAVSCVRNKNRTCFVLFGIFTILALGNATPIYDVLYNYLPFFSSLRGVSKFAGIANLFAIYVVGCGLDSMGVGSMLNAENKDRYIPPILFSVFSAFCFLAGTIVKWNVFSLWSMFFTASPEHGTATASASLFILAAKYIYYLNWCPNL